MIDVYATTGTFADKHALAQDLAAAVMRWGQVPDLALFRNNTAAFVHELPAESIANLDGESNYVRVQVLTPSRCWTVTSSSGSSGSSPRSSLRPRVTLGLWSERGYR